MDTTTDPPLPELEQPQQGVEEEEEDEDEETSKVRTTGSLVCDLTLPLPA